MKNLKRVLFTFALLFTIFSCTNDEATTNPPDAQESASMQEVLTELRTYIDDEGNPITDQNPTGNIIFDFCFDFVYPIELIYNNGTTVTVESFHDLIIIIINSTSELYIVGIEFPFDVMVYNPITNEIEIQTINNEAEFIALLESCDLTDCGCSDEYDPVCVEIMDNGTIIIITFPNACHAECEGFTDAQYYPCDGCECPNEFDPVCVETPAGEIIQFDNECLAFCEGYTPNDFVDCPSDVCEISNLTVDVGDCNPDGTYSITIDFDHENAGNDFFDVFIRDNEFIGFFPLADLPLTIEDFEISDFDYDFLKVCINDNSDCCEAIEWMAPDCNNNSCDILNLTVDVGDCNPSGTYQITIDFDYDNAGNDFFDVYVRNDEFIGFYALADLPLTIENFEFSGFDYDFVKVCINDNPDCCEEIEWMPPVCEVPCNCPLVYEPVCVEVNGQIITYYNSCFAECDGFTNFVACNNECVDCVNEPFDPICVEFNGQVLTMYNECFLFCNGFTPNNIVICD